jgi:hypothetical protein
MFIASSITLGEALDLLDSVDVTYALEAVFEDIPKPQARTFASLANNLYDCVKPCNRVGPFWAACGPPGREDWKLIYACQYVADALLRGTLRYGQEFIYAKIAALLRAGAP